MLSNYIICSTQRSGSTFFCDCLTRTRCLGGPTEWLVFLEFNPTTLSGEEAALMDKPLAEVIRVRSEMQRMLGGGKVLGWKIMWSTMARMKGRLKREQNGVLDVGFMASNFGNPKYIYFERVDKIAQAISHVILSKTHISHVRDEQQLATFESGKRQLVIKNEEITRFLVKLLADEREWANFFRKNHIEPLRIIYEDLCTNVSGGVRDVARLAGVDLEDSVLAEIRKSPAIRKTGSRFEEDLAARYIAAGDAPNEIKNHVTIQGEPNGETAADDAP
jgi:LPS sulfotransferase NodH